MLRKIIFYFLLIIGFIGIGFLINNFLLHSKYKNSDFELPIIGFQGLIEKNDTIYIGSSYWNGIMLFDKHGKYLTYQGIRNRGKDFEFYFSENNLKINEFVLEDNPNRNMSSFVVHTNKKYIIENKMPIEITLIKDGKRKNFIKQSLFLYATQSDIGIWSVLMFYFMFVVVFFSDILLEIKNSIAKKIN